MKTVTLDDETMRVVESYALKHGMTLSAACFELIWKGETVYELLGQKFRQKAEADLETARESAAKR